MKKRVEIIGFDGLLTEEDIENVEVVSSRVDTSTQKGRPWIVIHDIAFKVGYTPSFKRVCE